MKKVIVIGCPGSGKSTFARTLHEKTGLPLIHLDMLYWNADGTTVERDVFRARLRDVLSQDEWIIDGNYASTMEARMAASDTVFFLDYPLEVCLGGIAARKGMPRSDMPCAVPDGDDAEFVEFIKNYNSDNRPDVMALLDKYADKSIIIFSSRSEADEFFKRKF